MRLVQRVRGLPSWGGLAILALLGCTDQPVEPASDMKPFLSEHRTTLASAATKEPGEGCTAQGASECRSGLCLHTGVDPGNGYFCSTKCQSEAQCPAQWRCTQVHPSAEARVCIPPVEWAGGAATPRG